MSKGPKTLDSSSKTTQTTAIDPILAGRQNDIYNRANTLSQQPYQPYTGQRFEDFTPDQLASFEAARGAAGAGMGELDQAGGIFGQLGMFGAPQVNYQNAGTFTAGNPNMIGLGQLGGGFTPGSIGARDVTARSGAAGYQQYMNPFENDVVGQSLADIERQRREGESATNAAAAQAGAFGGSRHGVANALTNRSFAQTAAQTAAGLRKSGFETALGFNAGDQARELQAAQGNQGADVATGTANLNAQTQAGLAGRQDILTALLANQAAGQRAGEFNASQQQQGGQFNAANALEAARANAGNAIAGAGIRQGAAAGLGALGGQRQQMMAQGADLLSRIGGQQQALGQANKDFEYQQFGEARDLPYQQLDLLSRILGGQRYGETTTGTTQQSQTNPNRGSVLGTLGGLAGLAFGPLGGAIGKGIGGLFGGGGTDWTGLGGIAQ